MRWNISTGMPAAMQLVYLLRTQRHSNHGIPQRTFRHHQPLSTEHHSTHDQARTVLAATLLNLILHLQTIPWALCLGMQPPCCTMSA
jgi:hypothetical protein